MRKHTLALTLALGTAACVATTPPPPAAPPGRPIPPTAPAQTAAAAPGRPPTPPAEVVAARVTPDADFRAQRPTPSPERPFKVPAVKRFRLKNGLKVILAESHKLPLVGMELVIKTGNAANPKGKAGLADLTADMLDEGTKTRNALAIADDLATLGA